MSAQFSLPFEQPIAELDDKLQELEAFSNEQDIDVSHEIQNMKETLVLKSSKLISNDKKLQTDKLKTD